MRMLAARIALHYADALVAELDTSEKRRRCVARFYGHRVWGISGTFTPEDVDLMTTPFTDTAR
jgi:hypothetical protein